MKNKKAAFREVVKNKEEIHKRIREGKSIKDLGKFKVITKEEIEANRNSAYDYLF